jgi:uncharacterized protein YukE
MEDNMTDAQLQQHHEQLIKVLAEISTQLKQIAVEIAVANQSLSKARH